LLHCPNPGFGRHTVGMRVFPGVLLCGLVTLGVFRAARADDAPTADPRAELIRSVAATEIQRTAALVAGDARILERIFAEELTYGHADGRVDTKDEFLGALTARRLRFHAINPGARTIRMVGDNIALIAGGADLLVGSADAPTALAIRYLAVYRLDPRTSSWKLTAYQATPVAAPAE